MLWENFGRLLVFRAVVASDDSTLRCHEKQDSFCLRLICGQAEIGAVAMSDCALVRLTPNAWFRRAFQELNRRAAHCRGFKRPVQGEVLKNIFLN